MLSRTSTIHFPAAQDEQAMFGNNDGSYRTLSDAHLTALRDPLVASRGGIMPHEANAMPLCKPSVYFKEART